jgi:cyclic pyranopterin phosphate synthase
MSNNFCSSCNRVRLTAEGRLLLCLGNEHSLDLREILRSYPGDSERLKNNIVRAMENKPERHYFDAEQTDIVRFMNMTGG